MFPESKNWLDEYRRRVRFCEERPITYRSSITDLHPPHQLPDGEMRNIDVILAIGAVWRGLLAKADFAYANSDLFSLARDMRMVGKYAVNGSNHFIMPLLFNEESPTLGPEPEEDTAEPLEPVFSAFQRGGAEKNQREIAAGKKSKQTNSGNRNNSPLSIEDEKVQSPEHKGGIGHFVLAIAEKVKRDDSSIMKDLKTKGSLVRLRFMDSAKETIDRTTIRRVARNIVRHSGWLGDNWPCFDANQEHWTGVLRQSGNRSGEHTVMNAWAYMLDIQLASTRERGLGHIFYKEVRKLILLALRGQLDSLTIRAFMQHTKYAIDQPLSHFRQTQIQQPDLPNPLMNTKTVALNEDAFNKILRKLDEQGPRYANIWRDMPVPPNGATTQQSGSAPNVVSEPTLSHTSQDPFAGPSGISASSANLPPVATRTWQESLDQGLVYHKALKAKNPRKTKDTSKPASKIDSSSAMADDEMILAIASIWEGLKRLDRAEYDFTYAGMDVFAPWGKEQVIGAVGGRNRFIMPLLLSSVKPGTLENQGNGKKKIDELGHLVLCVAELVGDDPLTIQITVFDSIGHNWYHHSTWDTATAIIKSSGWLGADIDWGLVNWRHPSYTPVPRQVGDNTCGLHVIFNAWATMLGIPIHSGPLRIRQSGKSEDEYYNEIFLQEGLEIVNLALGGFMDSATIQAFFNVHGYSVEQRFDDPARAVIPVNAVGMNHEKFRRTLLKYHWSDKLTSAEFRGTTFPEATITRLVDLGLDREQAWRALLISGGNLEEAANWHHYPEPPEEALSPKTPDRG